MAKLSIGDNITYALTFSEYSKHSAVHSSSIAVSAFKQIFRLTHFHSGKVKRNKYQKQNDNVNRFEKQ